MVFTKADPGIFRHLQYKAPLWLCRFGFFLGMIGASTTAFAAATKESSPAGMTKNLMDAPMDSNDGDKGATTSSTDVATTSAPTKSNKTHFEWDPIQGVSGYEIEITPSGGINKEASLFNVTESQWSGDLKPGTYKMRLRSKDKRGVPGEWSDPEELKVKLFAPTILSPKANEEIKSKSSTTQDVVLKWSNTVEASKYKIHIEDESKTYSQDFDIQGFELPLKLNVARHYKWTIVGIDSQGNEGDKSTESLSFTIYGRKLPTPKINTPETIFVRQLTWEASEGAEKYTYTLQKRGVGRKWEDFKTGELTATSMTFEQDWKGGFYKLLVNASANLYQPSNSYSVIFQVTSGLRTEAAEKRALMRKSIDRTVDWYFNASYLITQINYSAMNVDKGNAPSTSVLGGTGRIGLGYLNSKNPFGFLGIADLSGFFIGEKNYTYPSLEAHGVYRKATGPLGELRLSSGIYYKQIPEIIGDSITQYHLDQIGIMGLHGGGEYWHSINQKIGIQANARIYYPLSGQTPNKAAIIPRPSMQYGFMGSLRLNSVATGLVGYAYREDSIRYGATSAAAISSGYLYNETKITGHYLNFYLEWDL